jgi:carboxymethylenebutenolidase
MCDNHTVEENEAYLALAAKMNRRQFAKLGAGAAMALMLPAVANAQDVMEMDVDITTPDGVADCYFVHPTAGRHAAVIIWPDILGLRPCLPCHGQAPGAVRLFRARGEPVLPQRQGASGWRRRELC